MLTSSWTHEELLEEARKFHGYPAPGLILGGYMVATAQQQMPSDILYDAISETSHCLPDAIQLLTPCTIGNGWLHIVPFGLYALSLYDKYTGEGVRVHLDKEKLKPYAAIQAWYLKTCPKKEQNTQLLQSQIKAAGTTLFTIRSIRVRPERLQSQSKRVMTCCPLCGEYYPASHGRLCRSCQGQSPYQEDCRIAFPQAVAVPVKDAVGMHALHDMTRIVPGQEKGAAFFAGQQITAGDVCRLQQMGRNQIYVQEQNRHLEAWTHEDAVAQEFARSMPGEGVEPEAPPKEGKVNFRATQDGMLLVDVTRLEAFNLVSDVMCSTRHTYSVIQAGTRVAGSRAIPLYLSRPSLLQAMTILEEGPLFRVVPLRKAQIGILVTGTEVFQGLVQDRFAPLITQKAHQANCQILRSLITPDEVKAIVNGIETLLDAGSDLIITTAGLSVDPDDVTRKALEKAGLHHSLYGVPVLPGTMSLIGRIRNADILGVPACALFYQTTAFDLLFPRILADAPITRQELAKLGNGGLCMECSICTFPKCPFGHV